MTMRYDTVPIRATRNADGFIHDTPILTRTGVFVYRGPNGKERREYRSPDVVFAADSLARYKGLPITDGHPGRVNSKNVKTALVGAVMSPGRADGESLIAEVVVYDTSPIDAGRKELSVGYEVQFDETPGISPAGEHYDASQISIAPNHLALVSKGRAGTARLNLDESDIEQTAPTNVVVANPVVNKPENPTMIKVKIESTGIAYDAAPEVGQEVDRLRADLLAAKNETNAVKETLATTIKTVETQTARADSAESDIKKMKEAEPKLRQDAMSAAKARLALEAEAARHKCTFNSDSTDRAVRESVVKAVRGASFNLDGKSDDYVSAAYDLAVSESATRTETVSDARKKMSQDSSDNTSEPIYSASTARDKYRAGLRG